MKNCINYMFEGNDNRTLKITKIYESQAYTFFCVAMIITFKDFVLKCIYFLIYNKMVTIKRNKNLTKRKKAFKQIHPKTVTFRSTKQIKTHSYGITNDDS